MDYVALGKNIRKRRLVAGLRQEDLAGICHYSTSHIGMIEKAATTPSLETIIRIANALDVTVDQLLYESIDNKEMVYLRDIERRIARLPIGVRITTCEAMENLIDIVEEVRSGPDYSR